MYYFRAGQCECDSVRNQWEGISRLCFATYREPIFFMKDRIKTDILLIRHCPTLICHCPTEYMLADFLTKPLQGSLFRIFREINMGYKHTSTLVATPSPGLEERVEKIDQVENVGIEKQEIGEIKARINTSQKQTKPTERRMLWLRIR
jgi:hypothetical protein